MRLYINNTLRYVNVNKFYHALGNSLCVALPGLHVFTWSNYTASFNRKDKTRPLRLPERSEEARKVFSVFERTIA